MRIRIILFFLLSILVAGCIVSTTLPNVWHIEWDVIAIQKKYEFLDSIENTKKERPNVIIIMADDLGKYEVSAYGATDISTPHIDAIGSAGVRFENAYTTAPICAPSRASILTGRYQQRYGFETQPMDFYPTNKLEYNLGKNSKNLGDWKLVTEPSYPARWEVEKQGIPPSELNLAELYKAHGYKTALIGKWHLGFGEEHKPINRGFDYSYGFYGAFSLYTPSRKTEGYVNYIQQDMSSEYQWGMGRNENAAIRENDKVVKEEDYLTFALKDKAKQFITTHQNEPFFLMLAFSAPHVPFQAPQSYYDQFSNIKDDNRRVYLAMIKAMDDAVGDFMKHLKSLELEENTIVYFISDNGGASYTGATENGPLKGGKITHFEGGINVPFMMQWKGKLPEGLAYEQPVSSMDIFSTSAENCQLQLPEGLKVDGQNLIPYLTTKSLKGPHEKLYWRTDHIQAIRYKNWKLMLSTRDEWLHLYNLETDKSEEIDLKDLNKEEREMLIRYFEEWNKELPQEYLWPRIMDRKFIIGDRTYYFPA